MKKQSGDLSKYKVTIIINELFMLKYHAVLCIFMHVAYAENKCFLPFAHRVMFQRGEKLCAVPTERLKEKKHPNYVSITR